MNFVADDDHAVFQAYLRHPPQLVFPPGSPDGVVRVAEDHQFRFWAGSTALEVREIDGVFSVLVHEAVVADRAVIVDDREAERMIHGALYYHLIAGLGERLDHRVEHRDYACGEDYPLRLELPSMAFLYPFNGGLTEFWNDKRVPVYHMLDARPDGIDDRLRASEIGIGHPHREGIPVSHTRSDIVPFGALRIPAVYHLIEIVSHGRLSPIARCSCGCARAFLFLVLSEERHAETEGGSKDEEKADRSRDEDRQRIVPEHHRLDPVAFHHGS